MLKHIFGMLLVSGLVLQAMGPVVNYDEKFDQETQEAIPNDSRARLSGLELKSLVFQEQKDKKKLPVTTVLKGSRVVYINRLINKSFEDKKDIVVKNPIPHGATYVVGSATCNGGCVIYFSSDGGVSFSTEEREGETYTNLEFYFKKIASKQERRMGFRAIVN